jgi:hypothetical protein
VLRANCLQLLLEGSPTGSSHDVGDEEDSQGAGA